MGRVVSIYSGHDVELEPDSVLTNLVEENNLRSVLAVGFDSANEFVITTSTADYAHLLVLIELAKTEVMSRLEQNHLVDEE